MHSPRCFRYVPTPSCTPDFPGHWVLALQSRACTPTDTFERRIPLRNAAKMFFRHRTSFLGRTSCADARAAFFNFAFKDSARWCQFPCSLTVCAVLCDTCWRLNGSTFGDVDVTKALSKATVCTSKQADQDAPFQYSVQQNRFFSASSRHMTWRLTR